MQIFDHERATRTIDWRSSWMSARLGHPEPEFFETSGGFSILARYKTTAENHPFTAPKNLTQRQETILNIISQHKKLSAHEISQMLNDPPAERTLRDDLARLKTHKLINSSGMGRTAVWFLL